MNAAIPTKPCAHPECGCKVSAGQTYCSEGCQRQEDKQASGTDTPCTCGHSDCIVEQAIQRMERD